MRTTKGERNNADGTLQIGSTVEVDFLEPVTAITPGQAMVFYDKDGSGEVIGGAWIDSYDDGNRSKSQKN